MKTRHLLLITMILGVWAIAAVASAGSPVATPGEISKNVRPAAPALTDKAFGDPTDLKAAAIAAADYIRRMQSDITEDNAGNGAVDADPQDAGWDWALAPFEHSASASPSNLHGVIANSILDVYVMTGDPALFTVLQDVADYAVTNDHTAPYPVGLRYAGDISFLLRFAALPGVVSPAAYQNKAQTIWTYKLTTLGTGTAASVAEAVRDSRHGQGYDNGIIAWDVGAYVEAVTLLDAVFGGYTADAAAMAEVMWQDSFALAPGYFDFDGASKGYDPTYTIKDYWWYSLGINGLIQAFTTTGTHLGELPLLETRLLECQYADGAFGDQYGAPLDVNTRDWQTTAYAIRALVSLLPASATNAAAAYNAGTWLGATQDVTGAFVYSSGNHYPEIGAECAMALNLAYGAGGASVTASTTLADPAQCGATGEVSFFYDRNLGTPGLFGYEMVVRIDGPLDPVLTTDFVQVAAMNFFRVDDNLDGTFTVNATRFGADAGLLVDAELFFINVDTAAEGSVVVSVDSYRMRDPLNVPVFVDMFGIGFEVDCTNPLPVANITADPRHNKVDVTWTHDGTDTITYEIYRGLWYDTTVGTSAYPEYDDLVGNMIPTRPSNRDVAAASNEWEYAGAVLVGTNSFTDVGAVQLGAPTFDPAGADRGVYYYEVFSVDAALNTSDAAAANDRATNYWLGDVSPMDGEVTVNDITALGTAFATSDGDAGYDNNADVGPTDNWSAKGIPTTDNLIDFEDLMIFSLNFSVVGPAKTNGEISDVLELAWVQREDGRWALHLLNGSGLQGVHVRADVPVGSVEAGELLINQGETNFLVNVGSKLDVNLALMGQGVSFVGSGELFVVDSAADIKASDLVIDVRATDNSKPEYTLDKVSGANTPMAFALNANYPNPFNPMTKISFSLPAAQDVKLSVYSLDGRLVATLLNETRSPGQHDVVWMGRDEAGHSAASGTYFYRLDAGPYSQVRKMTLMK